MGDSGSGVSVRVGLRPRAARSLVPSGHPPRLVARVGRAQREWWADHLNPVRDRLRAVGIRQAAPASLALALASLAATASVRVPTPLQHRAGDVFIYRANDFFTATAPYRLPLSALLAQSWPQWAWTALVAVLLFAPLEARIGSARLLGCVFAGHLLSTAAVAVIAAATQNVADLAEADFGTSCLVVAAAAGYAWLRRSRLLAVVLGASLCIDAIVNDPATIIEHWVAAGAGLMVIAALDRTAQLPAVGHAAYSRR